MGGSYDPSACTLFMEILQFMDVFAQLVNPRESRFVIALQHGYALHEVVVLINLCLQACQIVLDVRYIVFDNTIV